MTKEASCHFCFENKLLFLRNSVIFSWLKPRKSPLFEPVTLCLFINVAVRDTIEPASTRQMTALTLHWLGSNEVKVLERKIPAGKPSHFDLNPCRDGVSVLILQLSWSSNYLSVTSGIFLLLKTPPYASTRISLMLPLGVFPYSPGSLEDSMSEQPCTPEPLWTSTSGQLALTPTGDPWSGCDPHCADKPRQWFFQVSTTQTSCDFNLSLSPLHMNKNALLKVPDTILVTYF